MTPEQSTEYVTIPKKLIRVLLTCTTVFGFGLGVIFMVAMNEWGMTR